MKKETLYIAYGSNLNMRQMATRCPTAKVVGASELTDYELLFCGGRNSSVATVEPKIGAAVPVLVWKLKPVDELALDHYEGWPSFYRKEMQDVELGGKTTPAMVYVMNDGHEIGSPSRGYYETIKEGYKNAGFDLAFLDAAVENSRDIAEALEQDYPEQENIFGMKGWW